ncbi:MAG: DNA polymerase III subunit alpha, partial [Deltaproteobacteria bacterium]|nr:DNA polymerase III subunit alpha [Deltaproteobacteria bacterium]
GSLVAFSLGITDVDPLRFDLLFERFLNPERKSMPDIDVDFCAECREEVIRYVTETYGGGEYVAQILTLGQMKARAVIRDVGRVLGMSFAEVSAIAKIVPEKPGVALADVASLPEIKAAMEADDQVRKLISMALLLENLPHHSSTHASGVVIGDRPLMEHMPVFCDPKSPEAEGRRTQVITQYNFECVEQNGLVKFDLLGLKTLTLIKHCLALLREKGTELDLAGIDYADQKTFALLCSGDVSGLFQIENQGIRDVLVRLKPNRLEDIVALVALYRPGPLKSGMVDTYIRVKNGQAEAKYDLDVLRPILEETFGVIVYQEQVMRIAQVLAGYTLGKADELRKAMGKKRPEEMARHRAIFMEGTAANGIPEHKASQIFDLMEKFAEYGFNKSHSVAYAYITFQTAFLKAYHPVEFMASLISSEADNQEKISRLISECRQAGIEVRPPDVGTSHFRTSVEDGAIVFGLGAVKGLGQGAIEAIIEARAEGPFKDLFDFCARINGKKVTRRVVEALIKCGAFDKCGGAPREVLLTALPEAMDVTKSRQRRGPAGGATLFASLAPPPEKKRVWPKAPPMSENERLEQEKELLGFYVSGHPLARFLPAIEAIRTDSIPGAKTSRDRGKVRLCGQLSGFALKISKKGNSYASPLLSDHEDSIEVMVFDKLIKRRKDILADGRLVIVTGKIEGTGPEDSGRPKIMADDIADLEESLARMFPSLIVHTSVNDLEPVVSFLGGKTRPPVPKGGPATSVFLSIRDAQGRAIYRLDRKLDISVDFFAEASRSLGRYNTLACSELATPFSQYDDA